MSQTPEQRIKKVVNAAFNEMGAVYINPIGGAYGTAGVSDKVAVWRGVPIACECKTFGKKPTKLQYHFLEKWHRVGGLATWFDGVSLHIAMSEGPLDTSEITYYPVPQPAKDLLHKTFKVAAIATKDRTAL